MKNKKDEQEFNAIIKDIINHQEFLKLKNEKHHDRTKFDHSYRIAKATFKYSKNRNMDTIAAVRGAMLHDFFFKKQVKNRAQGIFKHPTLSLKTAEQHFVLNQKEKNIISSHMFPLSIKFPKCKESILVSLIDKTCSFGEMIRGYKKDLKQIFKRI